MSDADKVAEIRAMLEWDWAYTPTRGGQRLHHVASIPDPLSWFEERQGSAVTTCGLGTQLCVPGIFSRLGMARCAKCCDRLGIARGTGSPKNDDALRPWVMARIADMPPAA